MRIVIVCALTLIHLALGQEANSTTPRRVAPDRIALDYIEVTYGDKNDPTNVRRVGIHAPSGDSSSPATYYVRPLFAWLPYPALDGSGGSKKASVFKVLANLENDVVVTAIRLALTTGDVRSAAIEAVRRNTSELKRLESLGLSAEDITIDRWPISTLNLELRDATRNETMVTVTANNVSSSGDVVEFRFQVAQETLDRLRVLERNGFLEVFPSFTFTGSEGAWGRANSQVTHQVAQEISALINSSFQGGKFLTQGERNKLVSNAQSRISSMIMIGDQRLIPIMSEMTAVERLIEPILEMARVSLTSNGEGLSESERAALAERLRPTLERWKTNIIEDRNRTSSGVDTTTSTGGVRGFEIGIPDIFTFKLDGGKELTEEEKRSFAESTGITLSKEREGSRYSALTAIIYRRREAAVTVTAESVSYAYLTISTADGSQTETPSPVAFILTEGEVAPAKDQSDELEKLREELAKVRAQQQATEAELLRTKASLNSASGDVASLKGRISSLEKSFNDARARADRYADKVFALRNALFDKPQSDHQNRANWIRDAINSLLEERGAHGRLGDSAWTGVLKLAQEARPQ